MKQEEIYWQHFKQTLDAPPIQSFQEEDWLLLADRLPKGKRKRTWLPIWFGLFALLFLIQQESRLIAAPESVVKVVGKSEQPYTSSIHKSGQQEKDNQQTNAYSNIDPLRDTAPLLKGQVDNSRDEIETKTVEESETQQLSSVHTPIHKENSKPTNTYSNIDLLRSTAPLQKGQVDNPRDEEKEVYLDKKIAAQENKTRVVSLLANLHFQPISKQLKTTETLVNKDKYLPLTESLPPIKKNTQARKWGAFVGIAFPTDEWNCFSPRYSVGLFREMQVASRLRLRASAAYHWWTYTCVDSLRSVLGPATSTAYGLDLIDNEVKASEGSLGVDLQYVQPFAEGRKELYIGIGTDVGFLQRYHTRSQFFDYSLPNSPKITIEAEGKNDPIYWRQARVSGGFSWRLDKKLQFYIEGQYAFQAADNIYQIPFPLDFRLGIKF